MYIEYVTVDERKVLHQMRSVEESSTRADMFDNAVRRLQATGFKRMNYFAWTDGKTKAYIHFGNLEDVRKAIIRDIHEYSFLD